MPDQPRPPHRRPPSLSLSLLPIGALIIIMGGNVLLNFKELLDPNSDLAIAAHIPLILAIAVTAITGRLTGITWQEIHNGMINGISNGLSALMILCAIGIMVSTWIASGIVPIMIYYGLQIMNPSYFLLASFLICCLVSLATGTSWSTAGTVGVALIGIGQSLGLDTPTVAGAIVSGAYVGDKISPLSDTTVLAPAVVNAELFEHIRHMLYTTIPAILISLILYTALGLRGAETQPNNTQIQETLTTLATQFKFNPLLFLPPLLIILMVIYRLPALPALMGAALIGALIANLYQGIPIKNILHIANEGYTAQTGNNFVDKLLSRGGLHAIMFPTFTLVFCGLTLGGVMERCGFLQTIADNILKLARSTGSLITATITTCIGTNIIAADQYVAIILPGRMYHKAYEQKNLHSKNLSRTLEDAGTLTSPLIPWTGCGATMTAALGINAFTYFPYCFFNIISPFIAIILAYSGWTIAKRLQPQYT